MWIISTTNIPVEIDMLYIRNNNLLYVCEPLQNVV